MPHFFRLSCWLLCLCLARTGMAQNARGDFPLHRTSVVHLATPDEAREILGRKDGFILAMSRFDRQCRLNTAAEVSHDDLLKFVTAQNVPWDDKQVAWMAERVKSVQQKLAPLHLPLPEKVVLIQTTGKEEGNAAYCRYPAVILPQHVLQKSADDLERLLIHELFHILSVHDETVRKTLYGIIGFRACDEIQLPPKFAARKLTNPDAPTINCWIEVEVNGRRVPAAPLLYASDEAFDPVKGGTLFRYLLFRLMLLEKNGEQFRPVLKNEVPVVVDPKQLPSYFEQIGRNTNYIIHPDEILADNFTYLVLNRPNLATPKIVEQMRQLLGRK